MNLKTSAGTVFVAGALLAGMLSFAASSPDTRLADAAQNNDHAAIGALLAKKVDVNTPQGDGTTALHWAAFNDDTETAKLLLAAGANVKAATRDGSITPLFMACRNGSGPMIEILIKAGAEPNSVTETGTTPLMMAASAGNPEAIKVLLDHGAQVNAKDLAHGQTPLMFAASLNRAEAIRMLIAHGADAALTSKVTKMEQPRFNADGVPAADDADAKPADGAAAAPAAPGAGRRGRGAAATASVAAAKDPEAKDGEGKETAAKETAAKETAAKETAAKDATGEMPPAQQAARGARGATTMGGHTALLYAARDGQLDAARALVESNADVNKGNAEEKTTPILMAIINGHLDVAKLLLDHGANPNIANVWGLASLYATIDVQWAPYAWFPQPLTSQEKITHLELMKALIAHGADVNAKLGKKIWVRSFGDRSWADPAGATPFWRAAQSDDVPAMKLLVAAGADPKIATAGGDTALMVAAGLGWAPNNSTVVPDSWQPAVEYCMSLGLDLNAVDAKGYTALHGVAFRGDNELIQFLVSKGAKTDVKTKVGDTIADMANGPIPHSIPHPETVALLETLGSANSHKCRSDQCLVEPQADSARGGRGGGRGGRGSAATAAAPETSPAAAALATKPPVPH